MPTVIVIIEAAVALFAVVVAVGAPLAGVRRHPRDESPRLIAAAAPTLVGARDDLPVAA